MLPARPPLRAARRTPVLRGGEGRATPIAATIWGLYCFFIGRLGGRAFEDKPWAGLLVALAITLAVSGLIELIELIRRIGGARRRVTASRQKG